MTSLKKAYESSWSGWSPTSETSEAKITPFKEGFQNVETRTTCPTGSTTGFPVSLGFTPTEMLYESVIDDVFIDIQYGKSANPPAWSTSTSEPLNVKFGDDTNITTLIYKDAQFKYELKSIQISVATHNSWLLRNGSENKADILLFFSKTAAGGAVDYIIFVIPILQSTAYTNQNKFLQGIYQKSLQGPFTVRDCFPEKNALFLRYGTCLQTSTGITKNVDVFVSSKGLPVNETTMIGIFNNAVETAKNACINGNAQDPNKNGQFCPPQPPPNTLSGTAFNSMTATFISKDVGGDFLSKVSASRNIVEVPASISRTEKVIRADQTSAYKCLPFDPDRDVTDGKIRVDLESGLIVDAEGVALSDVQAQRNKIKEADKGVLLTVAPGAWEKALTTMLAVIFVILSIGLLGVLIYTGFKAFSGGGGVAAAPVVPVQSLRFTAPSRFASSGGPAR